jgi:alkylation response protein AidB-like acyl-CoA dehydrogenase
MGSAEAAVGYPGAKLAGEARAELVLTSTAAAGRLPAETARTSTSFTIFEGTSEIQRMIIGRAVTGLDVR